MNCFLIVFPIMCTYRSKFFVGRCVIRIDILYSNKCSNILPTFIHIKRYILLNYMNQSLSIILDIISFDITKTITWYLYIIKTRINEPFEKTTKALCTLVCFPSTSKLVVQSKLLKKNVNYLWEPAKRFKHYIGDNIKCIRINIFKKRSTLHNSILHKSS